MIWDAQQRRYEDSKGNPVPQSVIRKHVDQYIRDEKKLVQTEAEKLISDQLSPDEFFQFMREKVMGWHAIAGVIAYGGESQMNAERWARINQKVTSELEYLAGFERDVRASLRAADQIAEMVANAA